MSAVGRRSRGEINSHEITLVCGQLETAVCYVWYVRDLGKDAPGNLFRSVRRSKPTKAREASRVLPVPRVEKEGRPMATAKGRDSGQLGETRGK